MAEAQRTIRVRNNRSGVVAQSKLPAHRASKPVKQEARTVEELRELAKEETEGLAESLSVGEIGLLADQWLTSDREAKALTGAVAFIKPLLHEAAKKNDWKSKEGEVALAKTMADSSSTLDLTIREFIKLLKQEDKMHLLDDVLSIRLTDTKKYIGEDALEPYMTKTTDPKGKFSIQAKKK